jgi:hypothetical protein
MMRLMIMMKDLGENGVKKTNVEKASKDGGGLELLGVILEKEDIGKCV